MKTKTPRDLTRAVVRAQEQLNSSGVDVNYTQMLSAIAAYHGFSNREEFLASVKEAQPSQAAAPETGLTERTEAPLQGKEIPVSKESFIEKLLKMSPQEIKHVDFRLVLKALQRSFQELTDAKGYAPGWMRPYVAVAESLEDAEQKLALEREYPYQVVCFDTRGDFRGGRYDKLTLVRDLAEGVAEMRRRLDECADIFGCALQSLDGNHTYFTQVRGIDGPYREKPDGLTEDVLDDTWSEMAVDLRGTFQEQLLHGLWLRSVACVLEERLCRGRGDESADSLLCDNGLRTGLGFSYRELYERLKAARIDVEQRQRIAFEQSVG